jgi:hypothetical protein
LTIIAHNKLIFNKSNIDTFDAKWIFTGVVSFHLCEPQSKAYVLPFFGAFP